MKLCDFCLRLCDLSKAFPLTFSCWNDFFFLCVPIIVYYSDKQWFGLGWMLIEFFVSYCNLSLIMNWFFSMEISKILAFAVKIFLNQYFTFLSDIYIGYNAGFFKLWWSTVSDILCKRKEGDLLKICFRRNCEIHFVYLVKFVNRDLFLLL